MATGIGLNETITVRELIGAVTRRYPFLKSGRAEYVALDMVAGVKACREPAYEPGYLYEDDNGNSWRASYDTDSPGWYVQGDIGDLVPFDRPLRPLRKLVPQDESPVYIEVKELSFN